MEKVSEKEIIHYLKEKIRSLQTERSWYQGLLDLLTSSTRPGASTTAALVPADVLNKKKKGKQFKKGK